MNIFERLKEDHRRIESLTERIANTSHNRDKLELAKALRSMVVAHSEAENATFYKQVALRYPDMAEELDDAIREHEEIEEMLDLLASTSPLASHWQHTFEELRSAMAHHIREEESEVFALMRPYLNDREQEQLGRDFAAREERFEQAI